jgi:hypothetical protein
MGGGSPRVGDFHAGGRTVDLTAPGTSMEEPNGRFDFGHACRRGREPKKPRFAPYGRIASGPGELIARPPNHHRESPVW